jgi:hypothetical protein
MFGRLLEALGIKQPKMEALDPTSIFGASVAASEQFHNEMMTPAGRRYGGPNYSAF